MIRKKYIIGIILMIISLIGIIIIQVYWIVSAIDEREETFTHSIHQTLISVENDLKRAEVGDFFAKFLYLREKDSSLVTKDKQLREFMFIQENKNTKETFIYKHGILEEDYVLPSNALFDSQLLSDSLRIKNYISKEFKQNITMPPKDIDGNLNPTIETYHKFTLLPEIEQLMIQESFKSIVEKLPITDRISVEKLKELISNELKYRNLHLDYEFAIYNRNIVSNVRSEKFTKYEEKEYRIPIFVGNSGESAYELALIFPKREKFIFSSIIGIAILSLVFMIIIVGTFIITTSQLLTHRRISQIKTDFINNITHEFKTPIATTNLILDAIRNPNTINNPEKVLGYLKMLKDENKRMHSQVENILQISRLEKGELEISKEPLDLHELIEMAIGHVQMVLEERGGIIRTHFFAENADISANESHFTNVLINLIENAIKYSPNAPVIDIYTENVKNQVVIRVKDQGQGMDKSVLKQVFHKFYREHTGDLHNVKGHGLGLAYVKSIVLNHNGVVYAESEKGKGSTFIVKLPSI